MKPSFNTIACAAVAACVIAAAPVRAAPPADISSTTWTAQINRNPEQLVITTQGGPGAPGAATCRHINGNFGVAAIAGWYCPATGRIHFVHKNAGSGNAVRVFTGNVSDEIMGQNLYMAGSVTVLISAFGDLGEYNFSAVK